MGNVKNQIGLRVDDSFLVEDWEEYAEIRKIQRDHGYSLPDKRLRERGILPFTLSWNGESLVLFEYVKAHVDLLGYSEFVQRLLVSYGKRDRSVLRDGDSIRIVYPWEFSMVRSLAQRYGYGFPDTYRDFSVRMMSDYVVWSGSSLQSVRKSGGRLLSFSTFMSMLENSFLMDRIVRWRTELTDEKKLSYARISGLPQELTNIDLDDFTDELIIAIYTTLRSQNIAAW